MDAENEGFIYLHLSVLFYEIVTYFVAIKYFFKKFKFKMMLIILCNFVCKSFVVITNYLIYLNVCINSLFSGK